MTERQQLEESGPRSFTRSPAYRTLLQRAPPGACRESTDDYGFPFTERHLQCVWYDALIRPAPLRTSNGETVAVRDPGRWNLEAGPDFLDAVLAVEPGTRLRSGDVEIHVHPGDWERHGHADRPAYGRLVAHVTYFESERPPHGLPPGTLQIPLRELLHRDPRFSFSGIDTSAYPHAVPTGPAPPCAESVVRLSPPEQVLLLEAAGHERLRVKALRMRHAFARKGATQVLYEEVFSALGYKHNRAAFRLIASEVPLDALHREAGDDLDRAYALLLGVAGLLPYRPAGGRHDGETRRFVRSLWDTWWKLQDRWDPPDRERPQWRLSGLRPQNHPCRRLAAGAACFRPGIRLPERILALDPTPPREWYASVRDLLMQSADMPYWSRRLSFRQPPQRRAVALIGAHRAASIIANVILPYVSAHGIDISPLLARVPPEDDNAVCRHMAARLFGRDHNPALYRHGLRQQGLVQLFHDFCLPCKGGCGRCGLPDALRASHESLVIDR